MGCPLGPLVKVRCSGSCCCILESPPAACKDKGNKMMVAKPKMMNCTTSVTTTAHKPPATVYNKTTIPQDKIAVSRGICVAVATKSPSA